MAENINETVNLVRYYECVILLHPEQQEVAERVLESYIKIVTDCEGTITRKEVVGKRTLAYRINRLSRAVYIIFNYSCSIDKCKEIIDELNNKLTFNDAILRHLLSQTDDSVIEKSSLKKVAEERQAAQAGSPS